MANASGVFGAWAARAGVVLVALAMGLSGIGWGLPSRARLSRVLEPSVDCSELREELMSSWAELHDRLGPNLMLNPESYHSFVDVLRIPPGWTTPPKPFLDSVRSFYLRSSREDEQTLLLALSKMRPWRLDLDPHTYLYGGTYIYSLGAWIAAGAAMRFFPLRRSLAPYMEDPDAMGAMYRWGRLFSVAAYALCGLLLLRLGRRLGSPGGGAVAALLFLLCPLAVVEAHTMKHYTFWTLWVLWTLDRSVSALETGSLRDYALAGAAAGLSVGTFVVGWPVCLVVAAAAALRLWLGRGFPRGEARGLAAAAAASAAAAVATNPYWVLDFHSAFAELHGLGRSGVFGLLNPLRLAAGPLRSAATGTALAAIWMGAGWALWRGRKEPALLLAAWTFLIGMGSSMTIGADMAVGHMRYLLCWLAAGALLAGRGAAELFRDRRLRLVTVAAALLAFGDSGLAAMTLVRNFRADSGDRANQVRAGSWIESHVPAGETIGMPRLPQPSSAPYFRFNRYDLRLIQPRAFAALKEADLPSVMVVTMPDYDERPLMGENLSLYERVAEFRREQVVPWHAVHPTATVANPVIEIYRRGPGARR